MMIGSLFKIKGRTGLLSIEIFKYQTILLLEWFKLRNINDFLGLLVEMRILIDSQNTNVIWSQFDSVEEVLNTLDTLKRRIELGDNKVISELKILFAPTGSFQEISIDSGWSEKFIELATRFDEIMDSK
ncbi:hypothetical protein HZF08_01900 [Paenibacillus sp. CGMCC 1.16610]|uniref:Uncharacterized protein n=1 Tax=Paenibacillus anseongense TaxID=2682845 RepID=A0ABW9U1R9_9BACL|nr:MULTISPECIES: hypothetical protein [Paenibacillus]MBA2937053.1 hypothetical protein [Paenibacillus sp. CGMCC 1.16610]MVQ33376.1 hypothetical protein [Paenibacillus anseongense]